jgi:hypothetical protein
LTIFLQILDNVIKRVLQTANALYCRLLWGCNRSLLWVDVVILGGLQWLLPEGRLRVCYCPQPSSSLYQAVLTPFLHLPENMVCDVRLAMKLGQC